MFISVDLLDSASKCGLHKVGQQSRSSKRGSFRNSRLTFNVHRTSMQSKLWVAESPNSVFLVFFLQRQFTFTNSFTALLKRHGVVHRCCTDDDSHQDGVIIKC